MPEAVALAAVAAAAQRPVELVLSCTGLATALRGLAATPSDGDPAPLLERLGVPAPLPAQALPPARVTGFHLGSAFCDRLLPEPAALAQLVNAGQERGVAVGLVTPPVDDAALARLPRLLDALPPGAEVVANDLGVLRLLARTRPDLVAVAGRLLSRMVKDPRLPDATWTGLYPAGFDAAPLQALFDRFDVALQELDVPPFVRPGDIRAGRRPVALHVPFGYALTGRSCQIGSLHQPDPLKFAPGHACRRECLAYVTRLQRPPGIGAGDLETFQRGNSLFYRHAPAMARSVALALARGDVARLVLPGDWHADHRPDQPR